MTVKFPTIAEQNVAIEASCHDLAQFLIAKNTSYNGSAFTDLSYSGRTIPAEDGINVRIVDKIKRLQSSNPNFDGEDAEKDLCGYLIIKSALKTLRRSNQLD